MKITIDIDDAEYRTLVAALNRHGHAAAEAWEFSLLKPELSGFNMDEKTRSGIKASSDRAFSLQGKIQEAWKGGK